jgi:threonyl-tRNA synthetase
MFGFKEYDIKLSTRPEKYSGTLEGWAHAEGALEEGAWKRWGFLTPSIPGKAYFTVPRSTSKSKIPWAANGNVPQSKWTSITRNGSASITATKKAGKAQVFMIHRALLGSWNGFLAFLSNITPGRFPCGLRLFRRRCFRFPTSFCPTPKKWNGNLKKVGLRVSLSSNADKIGAKIREATMQKVPYMLVVGGREAETKTVSVRTRDGKDLGAVSIADVRTHLLSEAAQKI